MKSAVVSIVVLLVIFVAWPVSASYKVSPGAGGYGGEEEEGDTRSWFPLDNLLSLSYYDKICPSFEKIVDTKVRAWTKTDPSLGPALLRLLFHDCGVTVLLLYLLSLKYLLNVNHSIAQYSVHAIALNIYLTLIISLHAQYSIHVIANVLRSIVYFVLKIDLNLWFFG